MAEPYHEPTGRQPGQPPLRKTGKGMRVLARDGNGGLETARYRDDFPSPPHYTRGVRGEGARPEQQCA